MDRQPNSITPEALYTCLGIEGRASRRRLTMLRRIKSTLVQAALAGALLCIVSVSYPQAGACAESATILDFGPDANLPAAAEFDLRGRWTIVHDPTAKPGVALQYSGMSATDEQLPLAIYKTAFLKNAEISIRLKVDAGQSDGAAGGIAVRLSSPRDYYLVQVDARRQLIFFLRVDHGATEEIAGVDADIAAHSWHTLTIRAVDDQFTVSLDSVWAFTAFDKILSQPGSIALWASSNSVARFDQIDIAPLSAMN